MNRVLITCDADSNELALYELRSAGLLAGAYEWLDTGDAVQGSILLLESELRFPDFFKRIADSIFIRHIAPVDLEIDLEGIASDLDRIVSLVPEIRIELERGLSFSVQSRILGSGKLPYRKVVLNEALSNALTGFELDCRHPQQVVSILCSPTRALLGVSLTHLNRSEWPGGRHRLKAHDHQISRAEFKLEEAIQVFGLELPSQGNALDIGASPGGWTRIISEAGLRVLAVDPGDLDPRLKGNRNIKHLRKRIQEIDLGSQRFDLIVNDLKMDARDSIEIMLHAASRLVLNGLGLITLKLPKVEPTAAEARKLMDMLRIDLERLSTGFEILGARQLYHNRSEVTVALRRIT